MVENIVAIYARKSKETDQGESVINQVKLCKEYAQTFFENKPIRYLIYADEGFSAKDTDRPEYQKMIHAAKLQKFNTLVCYRLDRISRSISDFANIIDLLEKHNISFVSIRERFDTSTPMGRAMMYISSVFAQLERETIGERIRDNFLKLARTGRWLGGKPPTGYKGRPVEYLDDNMKKKKMQQLAPIPKELELVKMIYAKYMQLNSLNQLLGWTLENKIKSKNDKDFDMKSLKIILTNTVYVKADEAMYEWLQGEGIDIASNQEAFNGKYGLFIYNKYINRKNKFPLIREKNEWIAAVGKHTGIISSFDWIRVQEMLNKNSAKAPRTDTGKHGLITSLLRCSCGSNMRITFKHVNGEVRHYYYKCRMKETSRGSRCDTKNLNGAEADELVVREIQKIAANQGHLYNQLVNKNHALQQSSKHSIKERDRLERELVEYKSTIQGLTLQLSHYQGSTAAKYIVNQIEELDQRIVDTHYLLSLLENQRITTLQEKQYLEVFNTMIKQFNDEFNKLDLTSQRKLLKEVVKEISWDGANLKVFLK